jgi:S-adenosylmethionine decarboxylase
MIAGMVTSGITSAAGAPTADGEPAQIYGQHLMLRLRDIERLDSLNAASDINGFLIDLVHSVGMRILDGPRVSTEHGDADHFGHSGIVLLYESHAAVHTYPRRRELFLDLFSCKPFGAEDVLGVCRRWFGGSTVSERTMLDRGLHWNAPAEAHLSHWLDRR